MKKIVSLLIAVAMIATFLCTAAFAAGTGTVSGIANAKPGDTVTIAVSISNNPGFDAAGFEFGSTEYLTVTGVSSGAKMPNGFANGGSVNHWSSSLVEGDGVMCYVTVKVSENIPESGTYYVKQVRGYVTNTDEPVASIGGVGVYVEVPEKPTEPQPTETEPVVTEPQPTETEPKPTETEPKPTETEPKPTETEPTDEPTEKPTKEPTEKPTTAGKDDQPKNGDVTPYPVFFLLAVMAVAATAFVLKRKFDV